MTPSDSPDPPGADPLRVPGETLITPAPPEPAGASIVVPGALWLDDLKAAAGTQMRWLWHGYLAPGNITLLTSQWKSGKTTLIAVLLNKMKAGGQLAGLSVLSTWQKSSAIGRSLSLMLQRFRGWRSLALVRSLPRNASP